MGTLPNSSLVRKGFFVRTVTASLTIRDRVVNFAWLVDVFVSVRSAHAAGQGVAMAPFPIKECLSIVLTEEWQHRLYAERDLDRLKSSARTQPAPLPSVNVQRKIM